jgi:hypothetical protein
MVHVPTENSLRIQLTVEYADEGEAELVRKRIIRTVDVTRVWEIGPAPRSGLQSAARS